MSFDQPKQARAMRPRRRGDLQDGMLLLIKAACLTLIGITLLVFVAGSPLLFRHLQVPCTPPSCFGWQLTSTEARDLPRLGLSMSFWALYALALNVIFALSFLGIAAIIVWRKGQDRAAVTIALILALLGAADVVSLLSTVWGLPDQLSFTLLGVGMALLVFLFPSGRFVPGWTRWIVLVVLLLNLASLALYDFTDALSGIASLATYITGIGSQVYRYRRVSKPAERQQTKWAVFGIAVALLAQAALSLIGAFFPQVSSLSSGIGALVVDAVWPLSYSLIPLSIGVAILRAGLWDIDIIINRTLVYALLTASLALLYWGGVALLQQLLRPITGEGNDLAVVVTTLLIAALFFPLRARIQALIDRHFYRRKYDAARTLAAFGQVAQDEVDLQTLSGRLLEVVEETMQPEHVSLWLRSAGADSRGKPV